MFIKRFQMRRLILLATAFTLVVGFLPTSAGAQDRSTDRFVNADQNANFGRAASENPNGGSLAWVESYYLDSYVTMYETTGDRYWLDKIVDHTDRMMGNATDYNGDGALGWKDHTAAHNQVKNATFSLVGPADSTVQMDVYGSFEEDADNDHIPDGWNVQGAAGKAYRSTAAGAAFSGPAGVIVESDGINENRLVRNLSYSPGITYAVEAFMSVDTEMTQALVEIYNATTGAVVAYARAHHVGFERYLFTFKAPSGGVLQLRLALQSYDQPGYKAYFDHISIRALDGTKPLPENGGMEKLNPADSTLPAGWNRVGSANASTVHTSADSASGSFSLATTTDGTSWKIAEQIIDYMPSQAYTLSFKGKVSSTAAQGRVQIYNATDGAVISYKTFNSTSWSSGSVSFTAPAAAGNTIKVRLYQTDWTLSGFSSYYDDLVLSAVSSLVNGGMEELDAVDPTMPNNWTRNAAANSSSVYTSTYAATGTYALATTTDNTSWKMAEQTIDYVPSQTYTLSFNGKVSSTVASGRVAVYNATDGVTIATTTFQSTSWAPHKLTFTAPEAAGKNLKIRLYQNSWNLTGFTSYFDDLQLYMSLPASAISNGGFETVDGSDPTLPQHWSRLAGTTSTDAHVATGINNYYTGTKGVIIQASASAVKGLEQNVSYVPGATYVLSYMGRATIPNAEGVVEVFNETDNVVLAASTFSDLKWTKRSFVFTAPSVVGKTIKLRISQAVSSGGGYGYVDVISLQRLLHTEAAGWTRSYPTTLAEAHRTNASTVFSEDAGLELIHGGTAAPVLFQELYNYRPNSPYGISFSGKASSGASGQVRVYDKSTATTLGSWSFTNTDKLTVKNGEFQTPAAGHELIVEVSIPVGTAGHTIWVDSFELGEQWEHMVHEGVIMSPVLRFVNKVIADPSLHAAYLSKALTYRDFAGNNLFHKWDSYWRQISGTDGADNGTGVYLFPEGFSTEQFPGRSLPHNQYLAFAQMLYLLYDATEGATTYASDRPLYWSRANDMERAFKSTLIAHPLNALLGTDAYLWNYWDSFGAWDNGHYANYNQEDISHAGLTMAGAVEAYHQGQVFTFEDMAKLTRTFTDVMWNGSLSEPVLSYYNSRQPLVTTDKTNTNRFHFWAHFAEFDPLVKDIANAVCEADGCSTVIASGVAKWSGNKVVNSGFERADPSDVTLPQRWTRYNSSSTTTTLTSTDPGMNDSSLSITTNGTTWQIVEQRIEQYEPNTPYTVSFLSKKYGSVNGRAQVYDYTTSTNLGQLIVSNTSWARNAFTIQTPEAGHDVRVRLYTSAVSPAGSSVGFDDVHTYPSLSSGEIANAGFETPDKWDFTLPRYWQRGTTTLPANAAIDASDRFTGINSFKLVSSGDGAGQELSYAWSGYRPSALYTVSFAGKVSGSAGGKLRIIDTTTNTVLVDQAITSTSWSLQTITFTAPSDYKDKLKVILTHNNSNAEGTVWMDELNIAY
jgi:hypothetical protein